MWFVPLYLTVIIPPNTTSSTLRSVWEWAVSVSNNTTKYNGRGWRSIQWKAVSSSNNTIKYNIYRAIGCIVIYYQFESGKIPLVKAVQPARNLYYSFSTPIITVSMSFIRRISRTLFRSPGMGTDLSNDSSRSCCLRIASSSSRYWISFSRR